jgi:hypothetical protein
LQLGLERLKAIEKAWWIPPHLAALVFAKSLRAVADPTLARGPHHNRKNSQLASRPPPKPADVNHQIARIAYRYLPTYLRFITVFGSAIFWRKIGYKQ